MNHISNLLQIKEKCNFDDLNNEEPKVNEEVESCSRDISSTLENYEKELENQCERYRDHINTTNEIGYDLQSLEDSLSSLLLEDCKTAHQSFDILAQEINKITSSISQVHIICEIHERLQMLKDCCDSIDYSKIVELMNVLTSLIETLPQSPKTPFVLSLKDMITKEKTNANALLRKEFSKKCLFVKEKHGYKMKICGDNLDKLHSLFQAIHKNESTRELLRVLPSSIWKYLFLPLIEEHGEVTELHDEFSIIHITIFTEKKTKKYVDVYKNISSLMKYLAKFFDCSINERENLMNLIGGILKNELSESLRECCVSNEIPESWKDLPQFKDDLLESTKLLENSLRPYGFIDKRWEWVDNVEEIYVQRKCKYFNDKAKELMRKDLHNMIVVGKPYDNSRALMETNEFLQCSISSYVPELIKLGEKLMNEICEGPSENCDDLFTTYKGIFFNYCDFVASHHQKLLETIPQQVALFYNNCMYLYRQLQKWDEKLESHPVLKNFCDDSSQAFYQVEEVGRTFLDSYVQEQKEQIQLILKGTNLQNRKTLESLEENTEKLFRQCLRQQELLKTVWSKVLSYPVYNKTIGYILNAMCDFLINCLVVLEDIGAAVAENLIELFKIVLNRGVKLFTDSNEVFLYVPQWHKFNELIFVLGASLLDISDRWADGKGPLALQFTPYELKQLIRALFQNSDRRAAVLSRIHE